MVIINFLRPDAIAWIRRGERLYSTADFEPKFSALPQRHQTDILLNLPGDYKPKPHAKATADFINIDMDCHAATVIYTNGKPQIVVEGAENFITHYPDAMISYEPKQGRGLR